MITRQRPFQGDTSAALFDQILNRAPVSPVNLNSDVPQGLEFVINKALEKDPDIRYQTVHDLRVDLQRLKRDSGSFEAISVSKQRVEAEPSGSKTRRSVAVLAASLLILVVALAGWWIGRGFAGESSEVASNSSSANPFENYQAGMDLLFRSDKEGNLDKAIAAFTIAVEAKPEYAPAHAGLAQAYLHKYNESPDEVWLNKALQFGRLAVEKDSHLAGSWVALGRAAIANGTLEQAQSNLTKAQELDPLNPYVYLAWSVLHEAQGRSEEAIAASKKAVQLAPQNWRLHNSLGSLFYNLARYDEAEEELLKAAELAPDSYLVYQNLMGIYFRQNRYPEASAQLQKALQIRPDPSLYSNLGTLLFYQGRYQESVAAMEKAVEMAPNDYLFWANLADAYQQVPGKTSEARSAYLRSIALLEKLVARQSTNAILRSRLAVYLASVDRIEEALKELETLAALESDNPDVLYDTLVVYEKANLREKSLPALEAALNAGYPINEIQNDPLLVGLREDIRYHRIVMEREAEGH
jgi:serine/threonine-protein kinase